MSSQRHRMLAGEPYAPAPAAAAPRPAATPGRPAQDHEPLDRRALGHKPLDLPASHDKAPAPRGI